MPKITNAYVYVNGDIIDNWPCDVDIETGETMSNGAVENLIVLDDVRYLVITSFDGSEVYQPDRLADTYED